MLTIQVVIVDIVCIMCMIVFFTFSTYWALTFIRRIHCCRKYKRGVARCISEDESGYLNKQFYYHYETEIWKNILLLIINFSEALSGTLYFASNSFQYNIFSYHFDNCTSEDKSYYHEGNKTAKVQLYWNLLTAVARSAELFVLAFCICLMNYLIIRFKRISHSHNTLNPRTFLILTTLLSMVIILTAIIEFYRLVSIILFNTLTTIYFYIFVHTSKRFKRALLQRSLERLIQYGSGSNKQEMKQYIYCKHTINIICCGYFFIIISGNLLCIPLIMHTGVISGKIYFPFNLYPSLKYLIPYEEGSETFFKAMQFIIISSRVFCFIGITLGLSPLAFVTINNWFTSMRNCFKSNKKIKYRYTNISGSLGGQLLAK